MSRTYPSQPLVGVGAVIIREEKLLLVLRGQPPAQGLWSIPGGRVEAGETLSQALEREVAEECGIVIQVGPPIAVLDSIYLDELGRVKYHFVLVDFWARYVSGELRPASDVAEARWIALKEIRKYELTSGTLDLLQHLGLLSGKPLDEPPRLFYRTIRRRDLVATQLKGSEKLR
ncbi:mutator mutT protein [Thermanaeromonas toyohensis ToBE]|uniref:Mutator mutT protein n=1 Tax=Thermanaeromonas toyohensis ToBE TaxID=698762 RepID=A0A1W1VIW8_9FIRM|nr:NUDIX hydrolase [Thermanaeromonas toyohensis]SMB92991.1 mutator mutT protein [Thermanaeromonas toyohensis ToBE]